MLPVSGAFGQASPLNNANFSLTGASVVGGFAGPNQVSDTFKLQEDSSTGNHDINCFLGPHLNNGAPLTWRTACIAKAAGRTRIVMVWEYFTKESVLSASVGFDLAGGNVGYDVVAASKTTIVNQSMTSLGGGWWLCIIDAKLNGTISDLGFDNVPQPKIYLDNGSGTAPRSISYTGNGTSGVDIFWFNLLPTAAWNITKQVFRDDFTTLNTIDLNNTLNSGFNWYINNNAPNSPNTVYWAPGNLPASIAAGFTQPRSSILELNNPGANQAAFSALMYSVGFPASGGYVGQAWQAPIVADAYVAWDSTKLSQNYHNLGPAFWGHMVEPMVAAGQSGMNPSYHWTEWDIFDIGGTTLATWDENLPSGAGSNPNLVKIGGADPGLQSTEAVFSRVSGLWLNIPSTGDGWGIFMSFFNGGYLNYSDAAYSPDTKMNINAAVAGALSQSDGMHWPIMIDTGSSGTATPGGWPFFVDYAQIYQAASVPLSYSFWNIFDQDGTLVLASPSATQPGTQLTKTTSGTTWDSIRSRVGKSSGKWYWEITLGGTVGSATSLMLGIMGFNASVASTAFPGSSANGAGARHGSNWNSFVNGVTGVASTAVSFANNDIFGFAFDADAGIMYIHRNGVYINSGPGGAGVWSGLTGDTWYPAIAIHDASVSTITANFGVSAFSFSVPGGYNSGLF